MNKADFYAETQGVDLKPSRGGPYYSTVKITINMDLWNMGFDGQNTMTLLHELGHAINRLAAGFGSQNQIQELDALIPSRSFDNQKLVHDKCTSKLKL